MFTWDELVGMGIRQRGYWLRQADAIRRQSIAHMAHSIGIALSSKEDGQRAIDELELQETAEESREKRSEATWNMLKFIGRGRSV